MPRKVSRYPFDPDTCIETDGRLRPPRLVPCEGG